MRIRLLEDIGVPVGVGLLDMGLKAYDDSREAVTPGAFKFEPLLGIVGSLLTGLAMNMGVAAGITQPALHACLPMGTIGVYTWVRGQLAPTASRRVVTRTTGTTGRRVGYKWEEPTRVPYLV